MQTMTVPVSCAMGMHDWDKGALVNGHHMCTRCPMWLENPKMIKLDMPDQSVQQLLNEAKRYAKG